MISRVGFSVFVRSKEFEVAIVCGADGGGGFRGSEGVRTGVVEEASTTPVGSVDGL